MELIIRLKKKKYLSYYLPKTYAGSGRVEQFVKISIFTIKKSIQLERARASMLIWTRIEN